MSLIQFHRLGGRTCWLIYLLNLFGCLGLLAWGMLTPWFYVAPLREHGPHRYIVAGFGFPSAQITYECVTAVYAENFTEPPARFESRKGCSEGEIPTEKFWNDTAIHQAVEMHRADSNGIDEYLWISLGCLTVACSIANVFFVFCYLNICSLICVAKYGRIFAAIGPLISTGFALSAAICTFKAVFPSFSTHPLLVKIAEGESPSKYLVSRNLLGNGRYTAFFAGLFLCTAVFLGFIQAFAGVCKEKRKLMYNLAMDPYEYRPALLAHKDCQQKHACESDLQWLKAEYRIIAS